MATTIAQNLQILIDTKKDIKDAIEDKGVDMSGVPFTKYANKIADISVGGGIDVYSMLISEGLDYYKVIAKSLYITYNKGNLFKDAWEHSLTVDPSAITKNSYPNGDVNGVIIPNGVTSIGKLAFNYWKSNNQPLVIPNSVTSMDSGAFGSWSANNQPLVIPNSVTSIGKEAFGYWESNSQPLVIPASVTNIGDSAFYKWLLVPYIIMEREVPPTIVSTSFGNQNNAPIYVPHDSVNDYKTATNWAIYASRIKSINDKP